MAAMTTATPQRFGDRGVDERPVLAWVVEHDLERR